jgi:ATP-dependent Lhr-like helicase
VWDGRVGNDTLAPLRALVRGGRPAHRQRATTPRARLGRPGRGPLAGRSGPPHTAGRWFVLPPAEADATRRAHAAAESLLERHGVVTRGAVVSERTPGGFAAAYKVLSAFEDQGRCRRGYFVDGLGAAQFGTAGAVDRLRSFSGGEPRPGEKPVAVTMAATDPANPYGAALPWPDRGDGGHRPGRKAGALVVLVDGELAMYVERGGRTLLTFTGDEERVFVAVESLGTAVRNGALGRLVVEKADGAGILSEQGESLRRALESAGFVATTKGLRLRA